MEKMKEKIGEELQYKNLSPRLEPGGSEVGPVVMGQGQ
jgi:hypothetical protein